MAQWELPGYREVEELGSGGFGRVVLAKYEESETLVAIKYLHQRYLADHAILAGFRREAAMLATVNSPHVVRLFDFVIDSKGAALVMEAVPGVSLRAILAAERALAPESALAVLKGSLLGLAAAHRVGVVHRDYKPDNVLVSDRGESKLVDFGLAVLDGQQGLSAGSPSYMAPEQWAGRPGTPATDVYAATCVFYQCITGQKPFTADTTTDIKVMHEQAPVPLEPVPEHLRGLVAAGMAKHPQQRPPNAEVFVAELERVAAGTYGPDWEKRGWQGLVAGAGALLALTPLALLATATTAGTPIGAAAAGGVGAGAAGTAAGTTGVGAGAAGTTGVSAGAAGTAASTTSVAAGAAGTATGVGAATATVSAGAGSVGGGFLATVAGKTVAGVVAAVAVGVGGVVAYNALTSDDPPAPVVQQADPIYAYTTDNSFGVANGAEIIGEYEGASSGFLPKFTMDGRYAFMITGPEGIVAIDAESGEQQTISCGGCPEVVPVGDGRIAWIEDSDGITLDIADLAKSGEVRSVDVGRELASEPSVGSIRLVAGAEDRVLVAFAREGEAGTKYALLGLNGEERLINLPDPEVNLGGGVLNEDGSKAIVITSRAPDPCSAHMGVMVIDLESGEAEELPAVNPDSSNQAQIIDGVWWADGKPHVEYLEQHCNDEGGITLDYLPSAHRWDGKQWVQLNTEGGDPVVRVFGDTILRAGVEDSSTGLRTLSVQVGNKVTKVIDNVRYVSTPPA